MILVLLEMTALHWATAVFELSSAANVAKGSTEAQAVSGEVEDRLHRAENE